MKPLEAIRIMKAARKHGEAVADLAIELINMVAEAYIDEQSMMSYINDQQVKQLEAENEQLKLEIEKNKPKTPRKVVNKAEAEEAAKELKSKLTEEGKMLEDKPKPRRGRPPKNKKSEEDAAIHALAQDLFNL